MSKKYYKPIFSGNADINRNAYLNWRTDVNDKIHNLGVLAEGYMESAVILSVSVLKDNFDKKADALIFPIIFNANHAIELYLKEILWCQYLLLDRKQKIEGGHNIRYLYNAVSNRMDDVLKKYPMLTETKSGFNDLTSNLRFYIEELYDKLMVTDEKGNPVANMDFSRYPFSKDYEEHFYVRETDNVVVDLENFAQRFSELGDDLDSLAGWIKQLLDDKLEADYMERYFFEE